MPAMKFCVFLALVLNGCGSPNTDYAAEADADSLKDLQAENASLKEQNAELVRRLDALEEKLAPLLAVVSVNGDGDVVFEKTNVYIRNGEPSGQVGSLPLEMRSCGRKTNGKGNLILGYNETYTYCPPEKTCIPPVRTGSHNLVLGRANGYSGCAGIVSGERSSISSADAVVLGSYDTVVSGSGGIAMGGLENSVTGGRSVAIGGEQSTLRSGILIGGISADMRSELGVGVGLCNEKMDTGDALVSVIWMDGGWRTMTRLRQQLSE